MCMCVNALYLTQFMLKRIFQRLGKVCFIFVRGCLTVCAHTCVRVCAWPEGSIGEPMSGQVVKADVFFFLGPGLLTIQPSSLYYHGLSVCFLFFRVAV